MCSPLFLMQSHGGGIIYASFIATAALLLVIVLFATRPPLPRNYAQYMNVTSTFYNVTVDGVCGPFNISILVTHVGRQVTMQIPQFLCNGSFDTAEAGLFFPVPAGLEEDVAFSMPTGLTIVRPSEQVAWCIELQPEITNVSTASLPDLERPNRKVVSSFATSSNTTTISVLICTTLADTNSVIQANYVYMGYEVTTELPVAPSPVYGPWYSHTIVYTSVTSAPVLITASGAAGKTLLATLGTGLAIMAM